MKRNDFLIGFFIGLFGAFNGFSAQKPQIRDLLTPQEHQVYQSNPDYRNRMDLFEEVLDRYAKTLRQLVRESKLEEGLKSLENLGALAEHIIEQTGQSARGKDLRSKEVKKLEIRLRKLIETLQDLKSAVHLHYQPDFQLAADHLEDARNRLLAQMFGEGLYGQRLDNEQVQKDASIAKAGSDGFFGTAAGPSSGGPEPALDDRFTQKEYAKLQENQELVKRVEAFLEIAESRLKEMQRRMQKKAWEGKEENPLEFHTYWDMVHAYERAIDGIMINIDEKAKYKRASDKDIRKSLELLNKKIVEFIPQLEGLKGIDPQFQDEELDREVQQALKTSLDAKRGSEYGLGAPVK